MRKILQLSAQIDPISEQFLAIFEPIIGARAQTGLGSCALESGTCSIGVCRDSVSWSLEYLFGHDELCFFTYVRSRCR